MTAQLTIPITDASQVGEARRQMRRLAEAAQLDAESAGKAAIIATELATNLSRHTPGGELLLRSVNGDQPGWVEAVSVDRGPGMADVGRCLADGYSTGGTAGNGLGAVRRLADEFDVYSQCPTGTVVIARLGDRESAAGNSRGFSWGVISKPAPHETLCGDAWRIREQREELSVMVVDGLGHGPLAAAAADEAIAAFDNDPFAPAETIFKLADQRMRGTRGGAMATAHLDLLRGKLKFTGVGNISGVMIDSDAQTLGGESRRTGLVSHNGTVGVQMRTTRTFEYDLPESGLVVLHSDGLQSRWTLQPYPGLAHRHPAVVAGVLARDFIRGRDDATVVAIRYSTRLPLGF